MSIILIITSIVLTQNQSPRNQNQKRSLRELCADFYTCHCWPCNNMPLNIISLCCYTSSCSDTLSDMCKSSVPTGYSELALLSCKPASARSLPSPIHYFRAAGDAGLQSEPFSKQSLIVNSFQVLQKAVRCGWEKLVLLLPVLTKQEIHQLIHSASFHP